MSARILIIDDEAPFREDLATLLRQEGFECHTAGDGKTGISKASELDPEIVLCDLVMQGIGGIDVVEKLSNQCPESNILILTAYGSVDTAVEAFRRGVVDYILKPVVPDDLIRKIHWCLEHRRLQGEVRYLRRALSEASTGTLIVGQSPGMVSVCETIEKIAKAASIVLVTGESGTGKDLVARSIHEMGHGLEKPFVAVNCAALPASLIESELFGHVRGAFTGAVRDKPGYFQVAEDGTLFLDEISELPTELQPKLLRALERQEVFPLGSTRPVPTRARIIAASNRDLEAEIDAGRFREDLYFRLNVVEIKLPPLRERPEDIPALVEHLLRRINIRLKKHVQGIDKEALRVLTSARWRGNVRELENVLERAVLLAGDDFLGLEDLPPELTAQVHCPDISDNLREAVRKYEREHIRHVLAAVNGNREEAARRLGVNPSTLYRRIKVLQI